MQNLSFCLWLICALAGRFNAGADSHSEPCLAPHHHVHLASFGDSAPWQPTDVERKEIPEEIMDQLDPYELKVLEGASVYRDNNMVAEISVYELHKDRFKQEAPIYVVKANIYSSEKKICLIKVRDVSLDTRKRPLLNHGSGKDATVYIAFIDGAAAMYIGIKQTGYFSVEFTR